MENEIQKHVNNENEENIRSGIYASPVVPGNRYYIRTATFDSVGEVVSIDGYCITMQPGAAAVMSSGRVDTAVRNGTLSDYETFHDVLKIYLGGVCDVIDWPRPVPEVNGHARPSDRVELVKSDFQDFVDMLAKSSTTVRMNRTKYPLVVGRSYFVRSAKFHAIGKVIAVGEFGFLLADDCVGVLESGDISVMTSEGVAPKNFENVGSRMAISWHSLIDSTEWKFAIPESRDE